MRIEQNIMTKNPCYKSGRKIQVQGLMLHSVGCNQPKASVFINNWNSANFGSACVHAFIDGTDGVIHQTLPWDHRGWHCASGPSGSGNNTHIGVEMCEPACIHYTSGSKFTISDVSAARACVKRTYDAAVELFAYLCEQFGLNPLADGVIISHAEGHRRGIASDHGDPEHLWRGVGLSYTMDKFRNDVSEKMEKSSASTPETYYVRKKFANEASQIGKYTSLDEAKKIVDAHPAYHVYTSTGKKIYSAKKTKKENFQVLVDSNYLRIREQPTTESESLGYTGAGVFTITETASGTGSKSGWGHLKSGAGWIALDYVTKL